MDSSIPTNDADEYRTLQAAALIKLYEAGRLAELDDGPVDPRAYLSRDEIERALSSG